MALPHMSQDHEDIVVDQLGGQPLIGSGFEAEVPDEEYSDASADQEHQDE